MKPDNILPIDKVTQQTRCIDWIYFSHVLVGIVAAKTDGGILEFLWKNHTLAAGRGAPVMLVLCIIPAIIGSAVCWRRYELPALAIALSIILFVSSTWISLVYLIAAACSFLLWVFVFRRTFKNRTGGAGMGLQQTL